MKIERVPVIFLCILAAALGAASQQTAIYSGEQHQPTLNMAAGTARRSVRPTELYKLGIGDVVQISLTNAPNNSGYYTVRQDGSIDFPLAGESPVVIAGMTLDVVEDTLSSRITLYHDAQVMVNVREYASHRIIVKGMAAVKGDRFLRREAMPLFAVRAESEVDPAATKVLIVRGETRKREVHALNDDAAGDALIFPGDTIEFFVDASPAITTSFFYIAGNIVSPGQREMASGMTLMQAVIASGGAKGKAAKAAIRRKTEEGKLTVAEYSLKKIFDGKTADPVLESGDMIEIKD